MEASALRRGGAIVPRSRRLLAALPDERLVDQIRRGNSAAFEVVYDRHYRGILSFCRHMLGSQEEAEDALQQTFASAYSSLQGEEREIRLKAWLYTVARNRCLSVLRARREQAAELDDLPALGGLSDEVQQRADLRELLHDLRDLPDEQREALVLFEIGDLSQSEVAAVIGVEPMKVKALVFQARSTLIENRDARAIPCAEIREQLATASGGALRRGPLRRHLKACEGCSAFRDQVRSQRSALALVLPVAPTIGLKDSVLASLGLGGGAGGAGAAAGGAAGAAGGGGVFASVGGAGVAKLAVGATLAAGGIAGGGMAIDRSVSDDGGVSPKAEAAEAGNRNASNNDPASASGPGGPAGGGPAPASSSPGERKRASDKRAERKQQRAKKRKRKRRAAAVAGSGAGSSSDAQSGSRGNSQNGNNGNANGHYKNPGRRSNGGGTGPNGNSGTRKGPKQPQGNGNRGGTTKPQGTKRSGGGSTTTPVVPDADDTSSGDKKNGEKKRPPLPAVVPLPE